MMDLLHIPAPGPFPAPADDPKRPANTHAAGGNSPNWTDDVPGHTIVRSGWGNWSNYDEDKASRGPLPNPLMLKNHGAQVTFIKNDKGEVMAIIHHKAGLPDSEGKKLKNE
jgi:hypothetical protein